jgi:hypothetical protein
MKRTLLRRISRKRRAALPARTAFNKTLPHDCEVQSRVCTGRAVDWHETIPRSAGGEIVPGPRAKVQGQRFWAACRSCHSYLHDHPGEAYRAGWLQRRYEVA